MRVIEWPNHDSVCARATWIRSFPRSMRIALADKCADLVALHGCASSENQTRPTLRFARYVGK